MKSIKVMNKILWKFGALIQYLQIDFEEIHGDQANEVVKSVNDAISKTLKLFYLLNCKEHVLDELRNPFPGVITVFFTSIKTSNFQFSDKNQRLNKLFPNLLIFLVHAKASEWSLIDGAFPSLQSFLVKLPMELSKNGIDESHVSSLEKEYTNFGVQSC